MLFLPVDLFSSYINGREKAIDRNWNDLNQSNQVQSGWLNNDAQQLKNWFAQDTYDARRDGVAAQSHLQQNQAAGSDLSLQLAQAGQPGQLASAQLASDYQQALAGASRPNLPTIAGNNATLELGKSADAAAAGNALIQYAPQLRNAQSQYNVGQTQAANQLLPQQTATQASNLAVQQLYNQHALDNPDALFPRQVAAATPASPAADTDAAIYSQAGILAPGKTVTANINGVAVTFGRDATGVFKVEDGAKRYIKSPEAASPFSFDGVK